MPVVVKSEGRRIVEDHNLQIETVLNLGDRRSCVRMRAGACVHRLVGHREFACASVYSHVNVPALACARTSCE